MKYLRKIRITKKISKHLPQEPGVYIFWNNSIPIYVGKALNLKNRVSSYFSSSLLPKTKKMVNSANFISYIKVLSELEALLLEAKLVRNFQPQYNFSLKDDKSPLYICVTNDLYPRVLALRKGNLKNINKVYGPFHSSTSVRFILKLLRNIFPYSDHKLGKKKCIYSHIGLCNPCPNVIEFIKDDKRKNILRLKYLANIKYINSVMLGRINVIKTNLMRKMYNASKEEYFEEANEYKEAIDKLNYITQPVTKVDEFLKNPNLAEDIRKFELIELRKLLVKRLFLSPKLKRIECYDVAHLAGTNPTASMVTFINGERDSSLHRHFRIRNAKKSDDISALEEVAKRRIKYLNKWGRPDLIVVDGGKGQISAFRNYFEKEGIGVVGISKRREALIIPTIKFSTKAFEEVLLKRGPALSLISRMRDEAHRFARRLHHHLVSKSLLSRIS